MHRKRKTVVQVYKPGTWKQPPPGIGDFLRGACHLHELVAAKGGKLKIDISSTGFSDLIANDTRIFHSGCTRRINAAPEFFKRPEHLSLLRTLEDFFNSDDDTIYVCTNIGPWNRLVLPEKTRKRIARFYQFTEPVILRSAAATGPRDYEVLCIRAGDEFLIPDPHQRSVGIDSDLGRQLDSLVENQIIPSAKHPIIVISDSYHLKRDLARRYGFAISDVTPVHGGFGGDALPVATDLNILKNACHIHHVNLWRWWWSGFSHYTSLICSVPSTNYVAPLFIREDTSISRIIVRKRA